MRVRQGNGAWPDPLVGEANLRRWFSNYCAIAFEPIETTLVAFAQRRRYGPCMQSTILVMAGGALGAAARYHGGIAITDAIGARWPWATLSVNIVGALLIGMLAGWTMTRGVTEPWRLFLGVGILGGFTTFSTFSLETWRMIEQGAWVDAAGYAAASVVITIICVGIGIAMVRAVLA